MASTKSQGVVTLIRCGKRRGNRFRPSGSREYEEISHWHAWEGVRGPAWGVGTHTHDSLQSRRFSVQAKFPKDAEELSNKITPDETTSSLPSTGYSLARSTTLTRLARVREGGKHQQKTIFIDRRHQQPINQSIYPHRNTIRLARFRTRSSTTSVSPSFSLGVTRFTTCEVFYHYISVSLSLCLSLCLFCKQFTLCFT